MYIVPNLPSPLFATLHTTIPEKPAKVEPGASASASSPASTRRPMIRRKSTDKSKNESMDEDAVLAPSF
jgi:hypothetical protein